MNLRVGDLMRFVLSCVMGRFTPGTPTDKAACSIRPPVDDAARLGVIRLKGLLRYSAFPPQDIGVLLGWDCTFPDAG